MRNTARLAGLLAGAAALCLTVTTSASAQIPVAPGGGGWDHTWYTNDEAPHGGTVYVLEHGDVVMLCDTAADGYSPYATVSWSTGSYTIHPEPGEGNCTSRSASDAGNLPENQDITIMVGLGPNMVDWSSHTFLNDH